MKSLVGRIDCSVSFEFGCLLGFLNNCFEIVVGKEGFWGNVLF